ncbi:Small GTPase superfamily [Trinorchestia longiramus]|nr:Small GTPase superfamily [Trinorchestia longiramus]
MTPEKKLFDVSNKSPAYGAEGGYYLNKIQKKGLGDGAEVTELDEPEEHLFKVIIIGDATVGKTSFVQRYIQDTFRRDYKGTVGVDFALKIIRWSASDTVKLQLWDIAGEVLVGCWVECWNCLAGCWLSAGTALQDVG